MVWRRRRLAGSDRIPSDLVGISTKSGGSHPPIPGPVLVPVPLLPESPGRTGREDRTPLVGSALSRSLCPPGPRGKAAGERAKRAAAEQWQVPARISSFTAAVSRFPPLSPARSADSTPSVSSGFQGVLGVQIRGQEGAGAGAERERQRRSQRERPEEDRRSGGLRAVRAAGARCLPRLVFDPLWHPDACGCCSLVLVR